MKLRDHKKYRNYRRCRELYNARDKRENLIGVETGFTDKNGEKILSGDIVQTDTSYGEQIVLFDKWENCYAVFRGCWYGERQPLDPRSYGKIDKSFGYKPNKLTDVTVLHHQIYGGKEPCGLLISSAPRPTARI